jgi:hypothetical protein
MPPVRPGRQPGLPVVGVGPGGGYAHEHLASQWLRDMPVHNPQDVGGSRLAVSDYRGPSKLGRKSPAISP